MADTIETFREKYPQYDSLDDETLSNKLYEKFYQGRLEKSEFETKFLGAPVKSDTLLGDEAGDWLPTRVGKKYARMAVDAYKGDAALDLPTVNDLGMSNSWEVGKASMFGNDDDYANAIISQYPDHSKSEDDNGNPIILGPDGNPVAYVGQPGFDFEDLARIFPKLAAFVPAAKAAQFAGKAAGYGARVMTGAGASAGTDAAMQVASGREDIDGEQVALTGALGGIAEGLAPAVGKAVKSLSKRMGLDKWSRTPESERRTLIVRQLETDGYRPSDLESMSYDDIIALGARRVEQGGEVAPDAAIAEQFGYQLTRGQAMPTRTLEQRAARTSQLNQEEYLRTKDEGQRLVDIDFNNIKQHDDNLQRLVSKMTDGDAAGSRNEAAGRVGDELRDAAKTSKQEYNAAYREAGSKRGEFHESVMTDLPDKMRARLAQSEVILDDLEPGLGSRTPTTQALLKEIENNPQRTMKGVENLRKKINTALKDTKVARPEDHRALKVAKKEFDRSIDEAVDNALFTGDMEALDAYKKARGLFAEHSRIYNNKDMTGKIITKMLDKDARPEAIANYMFGRSGLSKDNAANVVERYAEAVGGKDTPAFKAVKETYFEAVMRGKGEKAKGIDGLIGSMESALYKDGQSVTESLFTKSERSEFKLLVRALKAAQTDSNRRNPSGSGAAVARILNGSGAIAKVSQLPGIKAILERLESAGLSADVARALNIPTTPAKPISALPVVGAYSTSQ